MPTLHVPDIPEELMRRIRVKSASVGKTAKAYVIETLEASLLSPGEFAGPTVQCPLCGLHGPVLRIGDFNVRCHHCGTQFPAPEGTNAG